MALNIEKIIWSIYKITNKFPKLNEYKNIYNISEEDFTNNLKKN